MSNYQVGDKFVIEIEEICGCEERNALAVPHTLYRAKGFNSLVFDEPGLDKLERLDGDYVNENFGELQDEAYAAGLNDAWELAKKIVLTVGDGGIEEDKLKELFDLPSIKRPSYWIFKECTPQKALAKIEAYEKESEEIKVGDVVETEDCIAVVIDQYADDRYHVFTENGCVEDWCHAEMAKTGKHIDVSAILAEIGKE